MSLDTEEEKTTTTKLACLPSSQQQKKDLFNQSHVLGQFPSPTLRIRTSSWDSIRRSRPLPGRWKSSKRKCNIENHLDRVQNKFLPYQALSLKEKSQRLQQWQCRTNGNTFRKPDFPLQLAATVLDLAYQCIKKQYSYCFQEYVLQVPESFLPFINVPCGPGELGFNYTTLYNRNFYYIFL